LKNSFQNSKNQRRKDLNGGVGVRGEPTPSIVINQPTKVGRGVRKWVPTTGGGHYPTKVREQLKKKMGLEGELFNKNKTTKRPAKPKSTGRESSQKGGGTRTQHDTTMITRLDRKGPKLPIKKDEADLEGALEGGKSKR